MIQTKLSLVQASTQILYEVDLLYVIAVLEYYCHYYITIQIICNLTFCFMSVRFYWKARAVIEGVREHKSQGQYPDP